MAACLVAASEHRAWSRPRYEHLTEERERYAVSMQVDGAIVWLRDDDPGGVKHIVVDPCGTEKYIKA